MPIRFKCPHCKKTLGVKDHLAGRKASCPACKKPIRIPQPVPARADLEDFAAQAFSDEPKKDEPKATTIKFMCEWCSEDIELPREEAGKKAPCPECKRIVRVPEPEEDEPANWRENKQRGPSGAAINQPKKLDNAWGTATDKGTVSHGALDYADAYADEDEGKPLGFAGWTKRVFLIVGVCGLGYLGFLGITHSQSNKLQKEYISEAINIVQADEKNKLPVAWRAEVYRAAGELEMKKDKVAQARTQFNRAFGQFFEKDPTVDQDLFLMQLALSQIDMAGTEDEVIDKKRLSWNVVAQDLGKTLAAIDAEQARVLAMRRVGTRLIERKQIELAIGLSGQLSRGTGAAAKNRTSLLTAQMAAFLLARKEPDKAANLVKPPDPAKAIPDLVTCMAYCEGWARLGQYKEALDLAKAAGTPSDRLGACLGVAEIALTAGNAADPAAEARPFLDTAIETAQQIPGELLSPWYVYHLVSLCAKADRSDPKVKELVKTVGDEYRPHVHLVWFEAGLTSSSGQLPSSQVDEIIDDSTFARMCAWEMLARHNARLGHHGEVDQWIEKTSVPGQKAFLNAGVALGEVDRGK